MCSLCGGKCSVLSHPFLISESSFVPIASDNLDDRDSHSGNANPEGEGLALAVLKHLLPRIPASSCSVLTLSVIVNPPHLLLIRPTLMSSAVAVTTTMSVVLSAPPISSALCSPDIIGIQSPFTSQDTASSPPNLPLPPIPAVPQPGSHPTHFILPRCPRPGGCGPTSSSGAPPDAPPLACSTTAAASCSTTSSVA